MISPKNRIITIAIIITLLLLVPLIAMQFTNEVHWTITDFIVAGTLLLISGFILEFILKKVTKKQNRAVLIIILIVLLLLIWAELAVGLFGTPFAGS